MACEGGHCETAALLVAKGAAREARDNSGHTPLHQAAVHRHTELVKVLLDAGCDVDATDNNGVTALQMACAQGCRGIVEHLLAHGADVHLQNNVGSSALHAACAADAQEIVELLVASGADPALTDQWSQSPVSVAGGAAESPPEGFRRAARGSFSAILDLLTATTNLDHHDPPDASASPRAERSREVSPATNEGTEVDNER
ncbi:serine/threonine-protein phosphatase 6 regulatory ankyrin repeat subunit B-like [Aricia agestis]|uniref:serine/threonine-protein phosphatase 6 regulatory ankyrin repeat subunit B-like n=1 Tax=Aricia agestis TaxID=91739 RepID=UPI001C205E5D|nr:serine/threonine-protein phosphatase 6 regulatory ankyrin repeat subunit B-like [Aricia agestis]